MKAVKKLIASAILKAAGLKGWLAEKLVSFVVNKFARLVELFIEAQKDKIKDKKNAKDYHEAQNAEANREEMRKHENDILNS